MTLPLLLRTGDDWLVPITITDSVSGVAIDLTGSTVSAALFQPFATAISGSNGFVTVTDAVNGKVLVLVRQSLTATVQPQFATSTLYPCRISISAIDTLGDKHTYDPIPILPLRPQDDGPIPTGPQAVVLTAYQQGPAGASNSLTAAQINALVAQAVLGQVGPAGPQGPPGLQGPQGTPGANGQNGAPGAAGAQGVPGATGSQGVTGPQGSTGPQGAQGAPGEVGPTGAQGPAGAVGPAGPTGPAGTVDPALLSALVSAEVANQLSALGFAQSGSSSSTGSMSLDMSSGSFFN